MKRIGQTHCQKEKVTSIEGARQARWRQATTNPKKEKEAKEELGLLEEVEGKKKRDCQPTEMRMKHHLKREGDKNYGGRTRPLARHFGTVAVLESMSLGFKGSTRTRRETRGTSK